MAGALSSGTIRGMTPAADALSDHAARLGREVHDAGELGLGVEFADGNDAFWLLDDPAVATMSPHDDPDAVVAEYDRLDGLRGRAIHALRHHLADKQVAVARRRTGRWELRRGGDDPIQATVDVGPALTAGGEAPKGEVAGALGLVVRFGFGLGKPPSPRRLRRYLDTVGPPPHEAIFDPDDDDEEEEDDDDDRDPPVGEVVRMMRFCRNGKAKGPVGEMLLALGDRLPGVAAHVELTDRSLRLEFADGYDDLPVRPRDHRLRARVFADGPEATADAVAAEFRRIDDARRRLLAALFAVARGRGMAACVVGGMGKSPRAPTWYLGTNSREIGYNPQRDLTAIARRYPVDEAVRRWLRDAPPEFGQAVADAVAKVGDDEQPVDPPERDLPPATVPPAPPLAELTADRVAAMDEFAAAQFAEFWKKGKLHDRREPGLYDPDLDAWATADDWLGVARRALDEHPDNPHAVRALLDAGDPSAADHARRLVQSLDGPDSAQEDAGDAELVWRFRREFPEKAREYFASTAYTSLPYASLRLAHGDPVARRDRRFATPGADDYQYDFADESPRHDPVTREAAIEWARHAHEWSPPENRFVRAAAASGWAEVADTLEANPFLLSGLLTVDRREGEFDEPGALGAGGLFLAWSRLRPTSFLARLLVTIEATDFVAMAKAHAKAIARRKPETRAAIPTSVRIYRDQSRELRLPLAVAWHRCRAAGVAG